MLRRPLILVAAILAAVALALVLGACGGGSDDEAAGGPASGTAAESAPSPDPDAAAILVTQSCGEEVIVEKQEVPSGQTALQALDRVADVETASGGQFVTAVEGVEQDDAKKLAWLFYVNGEPAQKGAGQIRLKPGDVEWWDLHNYEQECATVPEEALGGAGP